MLRRGTHTFVELELTPSAYDEIREKLKTAGYEHALIDKATVDMYGIGVTRGAENAPIDMILHCPACHAQHIDIPRLEINWTNPPHREHECQKCLFRWKPSNYPTNGVVVIPGKHSYTNCGQPDTCKCGEGRISPEHY